MQTHGPVSFLKVHALPICVVGIMSKLYPLCAQPCHVYWPAMQGLRWPCARILGWAVNAECHCSSLLLYFQSKH